MGPGQYASRGAASYTSGAGLDVFIMSGRRRHSPLIYKLSFSYAGRIRPARETRLAAARIRVQIFVEPL